MDELQEARRRWIDELERNAKLQAENYRLQTQVFELQSKLMQQGLEHAVAMMTSVPMTALIALHAPQS